MHALAVLELVIVPPLLEHDLLHQLAVELLALGRVGLVQGLREGREQRRYLDLLLRAVDSLLVC